MAAMRHALTFTIVLAGCGGGGSGDGDSGESGAMTSSAMTTMSASTTMAMTSSTMDDTGVPSGCTIFPADNPWNTDVSQLPVHDNSDAIIASIGIDTGMHADFGTEWEGAPIGIPWVQVPGDQARVPVTFE